MEKEKDVFTKRELSEIYLYLSRGDLPVKYAYKTEAGSQAWVDLENSKSNDEYTPYAVYESNLLLKNESIYLTGLDDDSMVIFDFGPGEGRPVEKFLKKISKNKKVFYHAFDISQKILVKNKEKIMNISEKIFYNSDIIDFEDSSFFDIVMNAKQKYGNNNVVALLLGNTVGNFSSINSILKNMMSPFSTEDRFVVGIAKSDLKNNNWIENVTKGYSSSLPTKNLSFSTIEYLGISKLDAIYSAEFNEKENAISMIATFNKDVSVNINGKDLVFKKDQKIRIAKSEKVDDIKMTKVFDDLNMRIVNMSTSEDDNYVQFCLSNKNFF